MSDVAIPDLECRQRLLKQMRQARLGVAQFNLELDEVIARLELIQREQRAKALKQSMRLIEVKGESL